ncbi:hypothetical protein F2Q68_00044260 [Brassica cretica]|uniref:FBD domain-containing protein n=1 Tax=Brassica cretica TaxID=69181 RepID=A0A8S9LSI0_BRACR|nr:hypothetical protein F2Q68_00044260 [Brassica cretica]
MDKRIWTNGHGLAQFTALPVLDLLTRKFHLVEHLFLETSFGADDITYSTIEAFLANCPKLTCLTLKGLNLDDAMAQILVKREVVEFLNSLIAGDFRFIWHIDVSSGNGLACDGDERTLKPNFPVEKLKEERSNFELVA